MSLGMDNGAQLARIEAKLNWLHEYLGRHVAAPWSTMPPWPGGWHGEPAVRMEHGQVTGRSLGPCPHTPACDLYQCGGKR